MSHHKSLVLLLAVLACGCKDSQSGNALSRSDSDRLKSEKIKFETRDENTPLNANTRFAAGQLAETEGDIPRAITQYQAALKINPKHSATLFQLAYIETREKKFSEAIDLWNRYITATNNAAAGYSDLGFCCELAGRTSEAETAYKAGIAKDATNQPCRVNYGLMLAHQGKLAEAATQLQAVLTRAEVHYNIGSVLESQGKTANARAEYQQALQSDPNMEDAKARLAALD